MRISEHVTGQEFSAPLMARGGGVGGGAVFGEAASGSEVAEGVGHFHWGEIRAAGDACCMVCGRAVGQRSRCAGLQPR